MFVNSYLSDFRKFANSELQNFTDFIQIGDYASILTEKANELMNSANQNNMLDIEHLQKGMFETGAGYIKEFSAKLKNRNKQVHFL